MADVRVRSERIERFIRKIVREHLEKKKADLPGDLDPDKPWVETLLAAAEDEEFWDAEARGKALLYAAKIQSKPDLVDGGHHVAAEGARKQDGGGTKERKSRGSSSSSVTQRRKKKQCKKRGKDKRGQERTGRGAGDRDRANPFKKREGGAGRGN